LEGGEQGLREKKKKSKKINRCPETWEKINLFSVILKPS
jgi:hypothetical protein